MPLNLSGRMTYTTQDTIKCVQPEPCKDDLSFESLKVEEPAPREKKGHAPPPLWYLSVDDLNYCPAYMRGRLTLDKVNAANNDMAMYAEANSQLITAPRKKLTENIIERAMESESGDEAISPIVQADLKLKGVANDQDEVDTGAIKRCLLDQFSSSQNLKKCRPLVIKEEKTL